MNPFEILGIPNNSTKDIAKQAFRKLAMLHHPDKGGDAENFKLIKSAWELIENGFVFEIQKPAPVVSSFTQKRWHKPEDLGWRARTFDAYPVPQFNQKVAKKKAQWVNSYDPSFIDFGFEEEKATPKLNSTVENRWLSGEKPPSQFFLGEHNMICKS